MKTVIVFDTEDTDGMKATLQIINHLSKKYLGTGDNFSHTVSLSKVKTVKLLRDYGKFIIEQQEANPDFCGGSLRGAKMYADKFFLEQSGDFSSKY